MIMSGASARLEANGMALNSTEHIRTMPSTLGSCLFPRDQNEHGITRCRRLMWMDMVACPYS